MTRVLVTGGAGFIGSHIAQLLIERGWQVRVLDSFRTGKRENLAAVIRDVEVIEGDIRDGTTVRTALQGVDFVIHQAAMVSVAESVERPQETFDINVTGTLNVLSAARDAGVRRVVTASSCAVYGDGAVPARESQAPAPMSPYAASKLAVEGLALSFFRSYGLSTACLRYFNVFGPRQDPASPYSGVIAIFSDRLIRREPVTIYGDGGQTRDFIFVEDVARANMLACEQTAGGTGIWNIGTGRGRTVRELYRELSRWAGVADAPKAAPARGGEIYHSRSDPSRARKQLGFQPRVEFSEGLRRTMAWYTAQR